MRKLANRTKEAGDKAIRAMEQHGVNSKEFAEAEKEFIKSRDIFNKMSNICQFKERGLCCKFGMLMECSYSNCH